MAASDYWDAKDLADVAADGMLNEDVMQKIWDISQVPLPFQDSIREDSHDNPYTSWPIDTLAAPDVTNAVVSGADAGTKTDSSFSRVGNHSQTSTKYVYVTTRAQNVDGVAIANQLAYGVMQRQKELRRDVEAGLDRLVVPRQHEDEIHRHSNPLQLDADVARLDRRQRR